MGKGQVEEGGFGKVGWNGGVTSANAPAIVLGEGGGAV